MTTPLGVGDVPVSSASEEQLGLGVYADALADFVVQCDTPLTIGIQGDWGSGKTSLMNLVRLQADASGPRGPACATVWINTWKYAQLGNEELLFLAVLQGIVESLEGLVGEQKLESSSRRLFANAVRVMSTAARAAAATQGVKVEDVIDAPPAHKLADDLKAHAARLVSLVAERFGRVVLFIDDLDRIPPRRAVQILEALKNFLDVPWLVTVLACDYGVIARGLKDRVGVSEEELGRSFFDKIIQVPFRMPTHAYQAHAYIHGLLARIGVAADASEVETVTELLRTSVGLNPRTLKRHINTLLLLKSVAARAPGLRAKMDEGRRPLVILALTAMEARYRDVHAFLSRQLAMGEPGESTIRDLLEEQSLPDPAMEPWADRWLGDDGAGVVPELARFLAAFMHLIDFDETQGKLDPAELDVLREMMHLTRVSSVEPEATPSRTRRRWDRTSVLRAAAESSPEVGATCERLLHAFDSRPVRIGYGTGKVDGSFSIKFAPLGGGSLFSVFTSGRLSLNLGYISGSPTADAARSDLSRFAVDALGADESDAADGRYPTFAFETWGPHVDKLIDIVDRIIARSNGIGA